MTCHRHASRGGRGDPRVGLATVTVDQVGGLGRSPPTPLNRTPDCLSCVGASGLEEAKRGLRGGAQRWRKRRRGRVAVVRRLDRPVRLRAGQVLARIPRPLPYSRRMTRWPSACSWLCMSTTAGAEDVSVVGFDNMPESAFFIPP